MTAGTVVPSHIEAHRYSYTKASKPSPCCTGFTGLSTAWPEKQCPRQIPPHMAYATKPIEAGLPYRTGGRRFLRVSGLSHSSSPVALLLLFSRSQRTQRLCIARERLLSQPISPRQSLIAFRDGYTVLSMPIDNLTKIGSKRLRYLRVKQLLCDPPAHGQFDRVAFDLSGSLRRINVPSLIGSRLVHGHGSPLSSGEPVLLVPGIKRGGVHAAANRLRFVPASGLRGLSDTRRLKQTKTTFKRHLGQIPRHRAGPHKDPLPVRDDQPLAAWLDGQAMLMKDLMQYRP